MAIWGVIQYSKHQMSLDSDSFYVFRFCYCNLTKNKQQQNYNQGLEVEVEPVSFKFKAFSYISDKHSLSHIVAPKALNSLRFAVWLMWSADGH